MNRKRRRARILIVDDESTVRAVLADGLQRVDPGCIVETAQTADEALEKLQEREYALVITDYMMPGMNGVELAHIIRQRSPETQIVLITAYDASSVQDVAGSITLDGYIDKPVKLEQIRTIVGKVVAETSGRQEAQNSSEATLSDSARKHLDALYHNANARCVLLLNSRGDLIEMAGQRDDLDVPSISALIAANFMAAAELARLLGGQPVFKSSYHEGPSYDIYASDVNGEYLLGVIFGDESRAGIVRFYTEVTAEKLIPLLEGDESTTLDAGDDFSDAVDAQLSGLLA